MSGWYSDVGAGEPVVILASTLVLARSYEWLIECLAPCFRVLTVEMPGSGRATPPPRPWGFEDYAGWVAGFVEALRLDGATVVGHSNSGGAALVTASLHPHAVGRLVLADTVGGDASPSMLRVLAGRTIDAVLEPRLTLFGWHHVIYNSLFHTKDFFGQVWKSVYQDLRKFAPGVQAPTLLAWGARDHTILERTADALLEVLPNATKYVSPQGSHDWLIDRAPEFAGMLRGFVANTHATDPHALLPRDTPRRFPTIAAMTEPQLKKLIRDIPDFPKPGILFRDITPLLADPSGLALAVELLANPFRGKNIDLVVGAESRGFIFGTAVACCLSAGFVIVRKPGKLPHTRISMSYDLEYGKDTLEMHADAIVAGQRVLIVDDLLATGGTMKACCDLVQKLGGTIAGIAVLIELTDLSGRAKLPFPIHSVVQYG